MADIDPTDPIAKPDNLHATGGTADGIVSKNLHATSEPAIDAITAKITGAGAGGDATTDNLHATSEPAKPAL
ncbi:hypothetical protein [Streptomyces sp. NPDC094032]|uniref:hypothetical protein n=1 Tax=Streptomyces sp. NPDC094032 TaxID=3155308 RepID=UPI003327B160